MSSNNGISHKDNHVLDPVGCDNESENLENMVIATNPNRLYIEKI